jgi:tetratricopeptide (TPR) repeat protein
MTATLEQLVKVRSQLAEDLLVYYATLIDGLDRTSWHRQDRIIRATNVAITARILTQREEVAWKGELKHVRRAVVIGSWSGVEMSFLAQMTAIELAQNAIEQLSEQRAPLDILPFPICFEAIELAEQGSPAALADALMELLKRKYRVSARLETWMRRNLPTEQCWLILDARHQLGERECRCLNEKLKALETQGWQCRLVMVSRRANYDHAQIPLATLAKYSLASPRSEEIRRFIAQVTAETQRGDLYAHVLRDSVRRAQNNNPPNNINNNLLQSNNVFVGRLVELLKISDWMDEHNRCIIALTGIGGIGKSSLALAAALWNSWRYQGVIYLTAKDVAGPQALTLDDICRATDSVLKLGDTVKSLPTAEDKRLQAAEALNAYPYLLVLDNLEVLTVEQTAELARFLQLLDPKSGTMALLTLRPEHFPPLVDWMSGGLHHLPIQSLDLPDAVALLGESMKEESLVEGEVPSRSVVPRDSSRLEVLAKRGYVSLEKTAALEEMSEAAYCHPLLLRFAADELREPENSWDDVLRRLRGLRGEDLQEKVEDMIGKMCHELARRKLEAMVLLQTLLIFNGGATKDALRFVRCGKQIDDESDEAEAFDDACRAARRASLLDFRANRYDLHPLVRQYLSRRRPSEPMLHREWLESHLLYFSDYARQFCQDYDALEQERLNLFAAMDTAERGGAEHEVIRFACNLSWFFNVRGHWKEGQERMMRGLAVARRLRDYAGVTFLLHELGNLCGDQGDYEQARGYYLESLEIKKARGDKWGQAATLHGLGALCNDQGDYEQARRYYEQSLELEMELSDKRGQAATLHCLGVLCKDQGRYEQARRYYEQSLALKKELDDKQGMGATLHGLGDLCSDQGEYEQARRHYEQSLALKEALGDQRGKATTLHGLGSLSSNQGEYEQARRYYEQSLVLKKELGDKRGMAATLHCLGVLCSDQGEYQHARDHYNSSLKLEKQLGDKQGQAATLCRLADLERQQGRINDAKELHNRSLNLADEIDIPFWKAYNLSGLGHCAGAQQQWDEASRLFTKALMIAESLPIPDLVTQLRKELNRVRKELNRV